MIESHQKWIWFDHAGNFASAESRIYSPFGLAACARVLAERLGVYI
jgi:hypothetical protein